MQVVVHGGAGSAPGNPSPRARALEASAVLGSRQPSPVDAVLEAIRSMEVDPQFNAGIGSAVQSDGEIRTDAGIMTSDESVGAACAMPGVLHAISVAEHVRRDTPHVLMAGERAVEFASTCDVAIGVELWSEASRERWEEAEINGLSLAEQRREVRDRFGAGHDTVGAVATDGELVVAGTSTGGRWFALAGRVGDVPQVGCGYIASPAGGVSTTGAGEEIARTMLARRTLDLVEEGYDPDAAATMAIEGFHAETDAAAGIIVQTPEGSVGTAYSSDAMQTCVAEDGTIHRPAQSQYL